MPTNDRRQSLLLTTTKTSNPHFHGLGFHPRVIVQRLTRSVPDPGIHDLVLQLLDQGRSPAYVQWPIDIIFLPWNK